MRPMGLNYNGSSIHFKNKIRMQGGPEKDTVRTIDFFVFTSYFSEPPCT